MQIKRNTTKKTIIPSFIMNNRIMQMVLLLGIIGGSFLAGSWFLDKTYIIYYLDKGKNLVLDEAIDMKNSETYIQKENGLPTLTLDIPFDSLEQLMNKRDEAITTGVLLSTDDDLVNAKATLDGQTTEKIDLRLKGDWVDHIEGSKWSYRIHVKGDGQILGMKNFSIQAPETRQFLYEWAYHQHLMLEDILTTRYSFVNVVENGEYKGIYAIEESFSTELMESQGERAGIILRFDEDSLWINRANFIEDSFEMYNTAQQQGLFMVTEMEQANVQIFQSNSISADPVLNEEAQTAIALLRGFQDGSLSAEKVFDVEKFGRFLAITDFWASNHATYWHNLRFYYNPVTSLLEPIAYDGDTARYPTNSLATVFSQEAYFKDIAIRRTYAKELERLTTTAYLEELEAKLSGDMEFYLPALVGEYGEPTITTPWKFLESRQLILNKQINPPFPVQGRYAINSNQGAANLQIKLNNLMILPVKIIGVDVILESDKIYFESTQMHFEGDVLSDQIYPQITYVGDPNADASPQANISIQLSTEQVAAINSYQNRQIIAVVQIAGLSQIYQIPLLPDDIQQSILNRPVELFAAAEDVLQQHPFLVKQDEQTLIVEQGDWTVNGDLVIPPQYQLVILPGTTLRFEEDAILLTGNRILAKGTEAQPIHLTSAGDHWAGIVVLSADKKSILDYTVIENTASINRDGWILTGGVTFYESPVRLFNSSFSNHIGEDALNIIHSDYEMVYVKITNSASDALDTDFSNGLIQNCSFSYIGGDAIDVSGSHTTIKDSFMTIITDKAISAGEHSIVTISNINVDTANIGVASKDLSEVSGNQIYLHDIHYAGFAAYIKKPVYGPSTISVRNVLPTNVETLALVQTGNTVIIDDVVMATQDLDVGTLYDLGILGN